MALTTHQHPLVNGLRATGLITAAQAQKLAKDADAIVAATTAAKRKAAIKKFISDTAGLHNPPKTFLKTAARGI